MRATIITTTTTININIYINITTITNGEIMTLKIQLTEGSISKSEDSTNTVYA